MKNAINLKNSAALIVGACIALSTANAHASEDVKVLLEILLEKGVITQEEFDKKLKKAAEAQEIKEFNQAQDIRKATQAIEQRAEKERKIKTEFYGQASLGFYQASNMTSANKDVSGMSDQPKANNRIGFKASRELDGDNTAIVTLESNFSTRTGAIGRDSAGYGNANVGNPGASLFDREANVRWISKEYGTFIMGRGPNLQNDLSGAFDARQNWNFGGLKPIGRYVGFHSASGVNRADKLFRYISPKWNGLNIDTGVSFGGVADNDEKGTNYYFGGRYKNGNFELGYNHAEVRLGSASTPTIEQTVNNRVDFLAAKYTVDTLTVNVGYVMTRNPKSNTATFSQFVTGGKVNANTWFTGAVYKFTPTLSWNMGYYSVTDLTPQKNNDVQMFATGLTYSPYKEWDFFIDYAKSRRETGALGAFTIYDKWVPDTGQTCASTNALTAANCSESTKGQAGVSIGAQYKF
jgi:predicted porin